MSGKKSTKTTVGAQIIQGLEEFVESLQKKEPIRDKYTCRTIILDLKPSAYNPTRVRRTRDILGASQALFAKFLGVSASTVRSWERGGNSPSEMACRFMDEIRRDPQHWLDRLRQAAKVK